MDENGKITKKVQTKVEKVGLFGLKMVLHTLMSSEKTSMGRASQEDVAEGGAFLLCAEDQARLATLFSPSRRTAFLGVREALAAISSKWPALLTYQHGRPMLPQGFVSFSHGGTHAVAAFHPSMAVGVDVEGPRSQLSRIAQKFLHPEELAYLATLQTQNTPAADWALRVSWGIKEAVYKAAGQTGLTFAEDIRITQWPEPTPSQGLAVGWAQSSGTHQYRVHVEALQRPDGEVDCIVLALQWPKVLHITLTGAESSGKTTLLADLLQELPAIPISETARDYLTQHGRTYDIEDLVNIHTQQAQSALDAHAKAIAQGRTCVIQDTDHLNMGIWAQEVFGQVPNALEDAPPLANLYIMCAPDIPWAPDPLRKNPLDRDRIFLLHQRAVERTGIPAYLVMGERAQRVEAVLVILRQEGFEF